MKAHKSAKWWLAICNTLMQVDIANFCSALQYYHRFTQIFDVFGVMSYIYAKTHNPIEISMQNVIFILDNLF